eukprot:4330652-Prymnesium_polylepis.2
MAPTHKARSHSVLHWSRARGSGHGYMLASPCGPLSSASTRAPSRNMATTSAGAPADSHAWKSGTGYSANIGGRGGYFPPLIRHSL